MPSGATINVHGHITEPKVRVTNDGTDIVSFSVATDKKRGGETLTSWWRVSVFGNRAKGLITLIDRGSFKKGVLVIVRGEVYQRSYMTSAGEQRSDNEIDADDVAVIFTEPKQTAPAPGIDQHPYGGSIEQGDFGVGYAPTDYGF